MKINRPRVSPACLCGLLFLCLPTIHAAEEPKVEILNLDQARQGRLEKMDTARSLEILSAALVKSTDPGIQATLLDGMLLGLEGQRELDAPAQWPEVSEKLAASSSKEVRDRLQRLNQIFGDEAATRMALGALRNRLSLIHI